MRRPSRWCRAVGQVAVGSGLGSLFLDDAQRVAIVVAAETLPTGAVLPIALAYIRQEPLGVVYMRSRRDVVDEGLSLREAAVRLV